MTKSDDAATPDLVSTSQVAEVLGVGASTVSRMVTAGRLEPAYRAPGIRGAFFFRRADVDALVREERDQLRARLARMDESVPA